MLLEKNFKKRRKIKMRVWIGEEEEDEE